nr:zinc finger MYM-type protein 1-like [Malus domestica]
MGSEAFTRDGFKTWKKRRERFKMHVGTVGSVHNKVREAATNLMNQATHIETAVSKHSDQARKAYRTCLNASIKCTKFLLGLAFRGHDESATSSNKGNYLELLKFLADNDDKVREVVMENAPGNLKLLTPSIQKEIVNSCALETLDAIMDGLKDRFFSILVDEARDVSVKEQMAMVLRYVDDNGHVIERFVGIQHVTDTTSSSLKDAIDTFFSRNGLSISKLRGQGYDGASNMGAKKNIDIASFFVTANSMVNYVGASCKRRDLLRQQLQEELVIAFENDCLITGRGLNQEPSLKRVSDTRWNSHYGTLISIISMFSSVVHVLQMVIDDNPNESAGEANKLMRDIRTFEFVFHLFLMKVILGLTNDLSQTLQMKDQEIVNAMALMKSCREKLHWMRNNGFDALVDEVSSFCEKHHIDVPNMEEAFILPGRSRRNAPIKTNRHHYRVELFIYVIDEQITELEDRFNEGGSNPISHGIETGRPLKDRKGLSGSEFLCSFKSPLPKLFQEGNHRYNSIFIQAQSPDTE